MEGYDPRYQVSLNGPLTKETRDRLQRFRTEQGSTLKDIGDALGFSGPFISTLLNAKSPASIRTKHIPKMVRAIEDAEIEVGWRKPRAQKDELDKESERSTKSSDTMTSKLLEKFPAFDPNWPEPIQAKWFEGFARLMGSVEKDGSK